MSQKIRSLLLSAAEASEAKCGVSCACVAKSQSFFPAYFRCLADRMTLVPQEMKTFVRRTRALDWTMGEIGLFARRSALMAGVAFVGNFMLGTGDFMNLGRKGASNAYLAEKQ